MPLTKVCDRITREILAIAHALSEQEKAAIAKLVRQGIAEASKQAHEEYAQVARESCGADMDMAHKMQRRMEQKRDLLISNLSAMR